MKTFSTDLITIKLAFIAVVANIFGIYSGALAIAVVAAAMRTVYAVTDCNEAECSLCCRLWFFLKSFILSAGVTMILVHAGKLQGWSSDITIIISGVAAFMSKELLDVCMAVIPKKFKAFIKGTE